jgi:hypothetical protein
MQGLKWRLSQGQMPLHAIANMWSARVPEQMQEQLNLLQNFCDENCQKVVIFKYPNGKFPEGWPWCYDGGLI